jgi:hypothetical protein
MNLVLIFKTHKEKIDLFQQIRELNDKKLLKLFKKKYSNIIKVNQNLLKYLFIKTLVLENQKI